MTAKPQKTRCDLCSNTGVSPGSDIGLSWFGHPEAIPPEFRQLRCPWCVAAKHANDLAGAAEFAEIDAADKRFPLE